MTLVAWFVIAVVGLAIALLVASRIPPDLILGGALTVLLVGGVLTPAAALAGFANPGLVTVAALYVVVAGLEDTGAVHAIGHRLLGRPLTVAAAQLRLLPAVTAVSAFLNNTPVVAMLVPVVEDWCRRHRLPVSKFMIPLSYAAILGGTCSLIGTSTNLIVHGLVLDKTELGPMGFFDIALVGLPTAIVGIGFILLASGRLLPDRRPPLLDPGTSREYLIEMLVEPSSPLVGRTIEEAGLRHLPGAFVAELQRGAIVIPAVAPTERLEAGDRLVFVGMVESVVDLVRIKGLVPAPEQLFKLDAPRADRLLVEAVVAEGCPLVGKNIRDGRFRSRYDAVVIAAARNGERIRGKVGDIVLRAGDTLLVETRRSFVDRHRTSRDFLLVSEIEGSTPPRHEHAGAAVAILFALVALGATGIVDMLQASLLAAGAMLLLRCTTGASARASIDWQVLIVIGTSIGIGNALATTGAADAVARSWLALAGGGPWFALAALYVATSIFTAVVTNNAAAVLMFPIAQATAADLGVSLWPFVVAIMMAASASFATPIGYQTNLMVYGPGGYRFMDYVRIGVPLNILAAIVTLALTPIFWPF